MGLEFSSSVLDVHGTEVGERAGKVFQLGFQVKLDLFKFSLFVVYSDLFGAHLRHHSPAIVR